MSIGSFDFKELEQFQKKIDHTIKDMPTFIEKTLSDLGNRFEDGVVGRTPVNTGTLKDAWTKKAISRDWDEYTLDIYNKVENEKGKAYASYVEDGHRIMRNGVQIGYADPVNFMKDTVDEISPKVKPFVESRMQAFLNKHLE